MANLAQMVEHHSSRVPPNLNTMVSTVYSEEPKEHKRQSDWKKMQNIRVIARFRPPNKVEKQEAYKHKLRDKPPNINNNIITLSTVTDSHTSSITSNRKKQKRMQYRSVLDHVFNTKTTQKQVFKTVGQPLINAALNGFNATLFAYGQTGSGKTYSMFGANDDGSGSDLQAMGLIPRSFVYLFESLEKRCNNQTIQNYSVSIQTLQIYNKRLLDLLNSNSKTKLEIKTDFTNDSIFVKHLRTIPITSAREALAVLIEASKNRIVAGHKLNQHSSRSHMLVLLKIKQIRIDGTFTNSNINFGDLAGSENIAKAHGKINKNRNDKEKEMDNKRRKEGISINESLSALTRCINSLVKGEHPGYRDSPLTHVLQDSLGGNSRTTLLVCVSPHIYNRNETIRTLRFAATAKEVKNKAKINKTLSVKALQKMIKELSAENAQLKTELSIAKGKLKNTFGKSKSKSNLTLNYKTGKLLETSTSNDSFIYNIRSPSNSLAALHSTSDLNAQQQMVEESEQYMNQISNLNKQLQNEIENSKQLCEKNERQNLELDGAESTINHLRSENNEKVLKLYNNEKEFEKLHSQVSELQFIVNDYKIMFPNYKPNKYIQSNDINTEIKSHTIDKDPMEIQVEQLEKYLSSLGHTNTVMNKKISSNIDILPEIRTEMNETYEKTTQFYDNITKQTSNLQSQISSMKYILDSLKTNFDKDREKQLQLINNETGSVGSTSTNSNDYMSMNSDDYKQMYYENINNNNKSYCSQIFYCGGDKNKQFIDDIQKDKYIYRNKRKQKRIGNVRNINRYSSQR